MAFSTFDGFGDNIAVTVDPDGAGATASVTTTCYWRVVATDIQQALFNYLTFCSDQWLEFREGARSMTFNLLGYVSGGSTYSKPGSLMGLGDAATLTFQFFTGCTIVCTPRITSDANSVQAFGESARSVSGVASGEPVVTWVVS